MLVACGSQHDEVSPDLLSNLDKRSCCMSAANSSLQCDTGGFALRDGVSLHLAIIVEAFGLLVFVISCDRLLYHGKGDQPCPITAGQL
jgi:hypothetical protein